MDIKRLIVSDAVSNRVSFGRGNPRNYLTIHQTGNTAAGANAKAHHNLQARSGIGYGWHWQVDDEMAIQTHDHAFKIWHAGDGRGKGNTESISIEICVNIDGDYNQSVENGAKLAAMILKEENIDKIADEFITFYKQDALPFFEKWKDLNVLYEYIKDKTEEELWDILGQFAPMKKAVILKLCNDSNYQEFMDSYFQKQKEYFDEDPEDIDNIRYYNASKELKQVLDNTKSIYNVYKTK